MRKSIIRVLLKFKKFLWEKFGLTDEIIPFLISMLVALIFLIGGTYLFIELTEDVTAEVVDTFDTQITDAVVSYRSPALTSFLTAITYIGNFYGYLVMVLLVSTFFYLKFKNWRYILELVGVLALASVSNVIMKQIYGRTRPTEHTLFALESLSYPSGHAMSAMAFYGFLIYLCYILKMKKWVRAALTALLVFMILSIGISRIYLGVHYPSDIAGGFIAGFVWVIFSIILFNLMDLLRKRKKKQNKGSIANDEKEPEMEK